MSNTPASLRQQAQQGQPAAISALLNQVLQTKGITAKVIVKHPEIQILLESSTLPPKETSGRLIKSGLEKLEILGITTVKLYGKLTGETKPTWVDSFTLVTQKQASTADTLKPSPNTISISSKQSVTGQYLAPTTSRLTAQENVHKEKTQNFWTSKWATGAFLLYFLPVGIWHLWHFRDWDRKIKLGITVASSVAAVVFLANPSVRMALLEAASSDTESTRPTEVANTNPSPSPTPPFDTALVEPLLNRLAQESGFRPKLTTWGRQLDPSEIPIQVPTLLVIEDSWKSLTPEEKSLLIRYVSHSSNRWNIMIGMFKPPDSMYIDRVICDEMNVSSEPTSECYLLTQVEAQENSAVAATPSDTIQRKPLANLGTVTEQLQFQADDSLAVLTGGARPTSPPTLATLAGNPPEGTDICNLPYKALINAMYLQCFPEGISYVEMANIIGHEGEEISRANNIFVYQWLDGEEGILMATFSDNRLVEKSQSNLK